MLSAYAARRGLALTAVFADVRGRTESGVYGLVEYVRADLPTAQRFLRARVLTVAAGRRDRAQDGAVTGAGGSR
jgi:hypothetical protein